MIESKPNPSSTGSTCRINGMSKSANPYRNYQGCNKEYMDWENEWKSEDKKLNS